MEATKSGLLLKFYPPNLTDDELAEAVGLVRRAYDRAPRLCAWLLDALCEEQLRRLLSRGDEQLETSVLILPGQEWTGRDLLDAGTLATVMTYTVRTEAVAKLWDAVVWPIQAFIRARFERLERQHADYQTA